MRVIAGTFRSRLLHAPPGNTTRPTSDRLRETLFNVLAPRIPDCRFADLYAGTGAVGIEALSRGAAHVLFSEHAAAPLKSLRANLAALAIPAASYTLEDRGNTHLLHRLPRLAQSLDIVFLDPPYNLEDAYTTTLDFFANPHPTPILTPGALVIAEHATRTPIPFPLRIGTLTHTRAIRQGDTTLTFYTHTP